VFLAKNKLKEFHSVALRYSKHYAELEFDWNVKK